MFCYTPQHKISSTSQFVSVMQTRIKRLLFKLSVKTTSKHTVLIDGLSHQKWMSFGIKCSNPSVMEGCHFYTCCYFWEYEVQYNKKTEDLRTPTEEWRQICSYSYEGERVCSQILRKADKMSLVGLVTHGHRAISHHWLYQSVRFV
jgi:hypothetical protein